MARNIALSNLTILPGSLILGPRWSWNIALRSGYTALKVNPLRGWSIDRLEALSIHVAGFEYLWRPTFRASVENLFKHHDWMGFIADTCFIGYEGARRRCEDYTWSSYASHAPVIDFPSGMDVGHHVLARETECSPSKWLLPLDDNYPACLDTWHIRTYPNPDAVLEALIETGRIAIVDIQTRDYRELEAWIHNPQSAGTMLGRQLEQLRELPDSVSASVEFTPQHVVRLMRHLSCSYEDVLHEIRQAAQLALD